MKIIIGSANFAPGYGANKNKFFNIAKHSQFFKYIKKKNINYIDTAYSYRNSHSLIQNNSLKGFKIITKVTKDIFKSKAGFENMLINDLKKFNLKNYYGVLFHNSKDLLFKNKSILKSLKILKKKGYIKKIGVSIYDPIEYTFVKKIFKPDILQIQLNVLDKRFLENNFLFEAKRNKCEIHVRSIFLQGLLVNNTKSPVKIRKTIKNWRNFCKVNQINKIMYCINFIKQIKNIDFLVVGFSSMKQLNNLLKYFKNPKKNKIYYTHDRSKKYYELINPKNWE